VHALLRGDFPDLELSKIRYYENQGLVSPQRSKKGYRLYSERDVACLREAVRLADTEAVPLRIVRQRLIDQGLLDDAPTKIVMKSAARSAAPQSVSLNVEHNREIAAAPRLRVIGAGSDVVPPIVNVPLDTVPDTMALAEFMERSGLDGDTMAKLIAHGIVTPGIRGRDQFLRASDLEVATASAALLRNGADLRLLAGLRRIVEREAGIVQDLTASLRRAGRDTDETQRVVAATQRDVAALREAFMARETIEIFGR
jgi:DNA-binding transcriptional MerR regulator